MVTSYFSFGAMNTRQDSSRALLRVQVIDPKTELAETRRLQDLLSRDPQRTARPDGALRIEALVTPSLVQIAPGRERAFVPRAGIYGSVVRLLDEVRSTHTMAPEVRGLLVECLEKALRSKDAEDYEIAPGPTAIKVLGRLDPSQVEALLDSDLDLPVVPQFTADGGQKRRGFAELRDGQQFVLPLVYGEVRQVLLRVEHEDTCAFHITQFAVVDEGHPVETSSFDLVLLKTPRA